MNNTPVMSWEITTGGLFYYGVPIQLRGIFTMTEKVDRDILQRAVDTVMPSYPYFCIKPVIKDGRYIQEYNDAPFPVYEQEDPVSPGSPEANYHLQVVGCWENNIYIDFFHGMADGRGNTFSLTQSLMYYYCLYRYGEPMNVPNVLLAEREPDPEEYLDPFTLAHQPENKPFLFPRVQDSFSFPEAFLPSDAPQTAYIVKVPQKEFMQYTKAMDGSPAVITSLFLCRAIDSLHPVGNQPIVINMPVDIRAAIGCEKTNQNCIDFLQLIYSEKMKKLPRDKQATALRGQVFAQSDPDYLMQRFYDYVQDYKNVQAAPTVEAKKAELAKILPVVPGACVSYMGQLPRGDVDQYLKQMRCMFDATGFGIVIEVTASDGMLSICFLNGLTTDAYYKAFLKQLEQASIPFEEEAPFVNPPRKAFW